VWTVIGRLRMRGKPIGLVERGGLRSDKENKEDLPKGCSVANRLRVVRSPLGAGRGDRKRLSRNVGNYPSTQSNIPEERIFHFHHGGSLKSRFFI